MSFSSSYIPVHRCPNVLGARRIAAGPSPAKPVLDAFMVSTLRRVVKKFDVDLVDAHNYEALLVALAARVRPIVYHAHNAMADELPYYTRGKTLSRGLGRWLDTFFPHRADRIVAPHTALADYLIGRGCTSAQIAVIAPSVQIASLHAHPANAKTRIALNAASTSGVGSKHKVRYVVTKGSHRLLGVRRLGSGG